MAGPFDAVYPDTYNTIQDILKRQRDTKRQAMLDQLHSQQVQAQIDTERENAETNREYRKGLIEDRAASRAAQADAKKDADYKAKTGNFTMGDIIPQGLLPDARQRGDVTQKPAFNDMMQVNGENMFPFGTGMPDAGNFTKGGEGSGMAPAPPPSLMAPDKEVWSGTRQEKEDDATAKRVRDFVLSMGGKQSNPFAQMALGAVNADPKHAAQILDTYLAHAMTNSQKPSTIHRVEYGPDGQVKSEHDYPAGTSFGTLPQPHQPPQAPPVIMPGGMNPVDSSDNSPLIASSRLDKNGLPVFLRPDGTPPVGKPTFIQKPSTGSQKLQWLDPQTEARYANAFRAAQGFAPTDTSDQANTARSLATIFRGSLLGEARAKKVAPEGLLNTADEMSRRYPRMTFDQAMTKVTPSRPFTPEEQAQLRTFFNMLTGQQ
jgi:hypothetical protein